MNTPAQVFNNGRVAYEVVAAASPGIGSPNAEKLAKALATTKDAHPFYAPFIDKDAVNPLCILPPSWRIVRDSAPTFLPQDEPAAATTLSKTIDPMSLKACSFSREARHPSSMVLSQVASIIMLRV